jgi:bacterioferritin
MAAKAKVVPAVAALQEAFDAEMRGIALYTHLAFRVSGPQTHGIVAHLREQAAESLQHAEAVGDRMVRLGAPPAAAPLATPAVAPKSLDELLRVSLAHERAAVECYRRVLARAGDDIALEEFARGMVATESDHAADLEKLLRPMS